MGSILQEPGKCGETQLQLSLPQGGEWLRSQIHFSKAPQSAPSLRTLAVSGHAKLQLDLRIPGTPSRAGEEVEPLECWVYGRLGGDLECGKSNGNYVKWPVLGVGQSAGLLWGRILGGLGP